MATISKRTGRNGKISYHVKVRLKGHSPVSATHRTLTHAKDWAQRVENEIKDGRYQRVNEARKHTLAELIDRYNQVELPKKAPKTAADQTIQLRWWKRRYGHLLLEAITPPILAQARDELGVETIRGNASRTPATVNRYLAVMSHALAVAFREWHWLHSNPMNQVSKLREPGGRVRYLNEAERSALLKASRESQNPYLFPIIILALTTGARKSEILKLKWTQVSLSQARIEIYETKNGEVKALPITGPATDAVAQLYESRSPKCEFVFPGTDPSKPIDIRKPWKKALQVAGISNFRFHDLRHTTASYLAMNGESSLIIAKVLGHKSLSMVKRYAHLSNSDATRALSAMNGKYLETNTKHTQIEGENHVR